MDYNSRLSAILNKPANRICAECNSRNPRWASISLGVFVCIRCCGIHRKLGTHISKMKSCTLDRWTQEMFYILETLDNDIANAHWEARKPSHVEKPTENTSSHQLEKFLRDKYERKLWVKEGVSPDLVKSVLAGESVKQESPRVTHTKPQEANLLDDMEHKQSTPVPAPQSWPSEQPKIPQFVQSHSAPVQNTTQLPQFPSNPPQHFANSAQLFSNPMQPTNPTPQQYTNPTPQQYTNPPQQFPNTTQQFSNPTQPTNPNHSQYTSPPQQFSNPNQQFANTTQFPNSTQPTNPTPQQFSNPMQQYPSPMEQYTTAPQHAGAPYYLPPGSAPSQPSFPPQGNYSQPQQSFESREQEKNRKIGQVMAMYQTMPQPTQPQQPFQALGAIAAQQFLSAQNPYAQQRNWPQF